MEKHNTEWFKQRAREKRERDAGRRSYQKNRARRDLEELEALYQKKSTGSILSSLASLSLSFICNSASLGGEIIPRLFCFLAWKNYFVDG